MESQDLAPFAALIGTWDVESTHPLFGGGVVTGVATYEWLWDRKYVLVRSTNDHELFPDAHGVIGPPEEGEGLKLEYFDSRGVRRTYDVSFSGGVYRWWRDHLGFDQRLEARVEGDEFVLQAQLAETRGEWKDDLRSVYRRRV
jgi:hypothetical protein